MPSSEMPLVSIVTPSRNSVAWINRCIHSVRAQTYPHIEHLVMDAASTDGTVALLQGTSGLQWVSEADDGQTDALRKGFQRARGEVLAWLNADDELLPDAVSAVVDAFRREPAAALVYGWSIVHEGERERLEQPPGRLRVSDLDRRNPLPQPSCFFSRTAYDSVGGLDPAFHLAMDLDLWLRLMATGRPMVCLPMPLSVIEVHPEAKTRAVSAARWSEEMGRARLKNGRLRAAAVEFGRAAAHQATDADRVNRRELANAVHEVRTRVPEVPTRVVAAAAYVQASANDKAAGPARLRHLARLDVWSQRETRQELVAILRSRLRPPGRRGPLRTKMMTGKLSA